MAGNEFINRITELANRAYLRGIVTHSDFLSPSEAEEVRCAKLPVPCEFFGGAEFCERKIAAFGDSCGAYPLAVLKIVPKSEKFSKPLTHRDFLGAFLGLGIERCKTGDIFTNGKTAYAVVSDKLVQFVTENLVKVGPNAVTCSVCGGVLEEFAPKKEERKINVSSPRIDSVICRLYDLPRDTGAEAVALGKVAVNGRECTAPSYSPKEGDVISVRGYGKFIYKGECGVSAKGRLFIAVEVYK